MNWKKKENGIKFLLGEVDSFGSARKNETSVIKLIKVMFKSYLILIIKFNYLHLKYIIQWYTLIERVDSCFSNTNFDSLFLFQSKVKLYLFGAGLFSIIFFLFTLSYANFASVPKPLFIEWLFFFIFWSSNFLRSKVPAEVGL